MEVSEEICIIFHVIEDKSNLPVSFKIYLPFEKDKEIDINAPLKLEEKYFGELKDKFLTYLILNIDNVESKFLITLYYASNYITIIKSTKVGVSYEIINQITTDRKTSFIDKIELQGDNGKSIEVKISDNIGNKFRKRFLIVNSPIKINLPIKFTNIKKNSSYTVLVLPKDKIIVHEIFEQEKNDKISISINDFKSLETKIGNVMKNYDKDETTKLNNEMGKFDNYFQQNLLNKENFNWTTEEFIAYYYFYIFHLFLSSKQAKKNEELEYYSSSLTLYSNKYKELLETFDLNAYDKILAISTLYSLINFNAMDDINKYCLLGDYYIETMNNHKFQCYKYAFDFLSDIIKKLKEESFIFLPLLQVISGYGIDLNSDDNKTEIFELSMMNVDMVKSHLKLLMPKFFIRVNNRGIRDVRGYMDRHTGIMCIYERTIFRNNIPLEVNDYMNLRPKDSAINASFTISHELFMHKNLGTVFTSPKGEETLKKFISQKLGIKTIFYTNKNIFYNCLASYTKEKKKLDTVSDKGESGLTFEFFFGKDDNNNIENDIEHIILILKTYAGFGDLLEKVDLVINNNVDELINYINQKIKDDNVKPLLEKKVLNQKRNRPELNDNENFIEDKNHNEESEFKEEDEESDKESDYEEDNYLIKVENKGAYNIII